MEANFVKTPEYRKLREQFKRQTDEVLDRPQNLAPAETKKEAKAPPTEPVQAAPSSSKPPPEEKKKPTIDELLEKRRIKKPSER